MMEVYLFSARGNKFTAPVGTNQRSLNKRIGMFLCALNHSTAEYLLWLFGKWYQLLPFVEVTKAHNESELCEEQWQYNVILLYPKIQGRE